MIRLLAALLALLYATTGQAAATQPRPNIVLFFVDDLGWGDVSFNGNDLIDTPNIDSIARDGIAMSQFYAAANVCTPSRAGLLTGRYPIRSGMQHIIFPHSTDGLPAEEVTLAEMLGGAGYDTAMIGKWHLGHRTEYWPTAQGFEHFFGVAYSNDMEPFDLYRGTEKISDGIEQAALSELFATEAERIIAASGTSPFFLYYADVFPHRPLHFPASSAGRSEAGDYGDTVETLDDAVGRVLAALENAGKARNTIVIFTSDNGPWFQGDPGPWRGRKGDTYDGGYRVPMFVRWKDRIEAGTTNGAMAMNIDLLPTIAALTGTPLPTDRRIDGENIAPMWLDNAVSPHRYLFFFDGNDSAAIRNARFKLQLRDFYRTFAVPFEAYAGPRLFDLSIDPRERYDVSMRHPDIVERLSEEVARMRQEVAPHRKAATFPVPEKGDALGPDFEK